MKTRLLSEEPSGIKFFLINQIFKEIINFLRIGKKQKWQKIETDGLSLKQNIRNMLKFSIWGGPRWGAVCTFQLCICHSIYAEFDNFLNLMIINKLEFK